MDKEFMPISEAKGKLSALVNSSDAHDVLLMKHGRPAAVLMSVRRHAELVEKMDDLEDRLSVHEREGVTMDYDKLRAELDLDDESRALIL